MTWVPSLDKTDVLERLAAHVGASLSSRQATLATAESCTGGWIAQVLTTIAGSSQWFERGFVTYSNEAKQEMLGVPADIIDTCGAVSEQTARAMAEGALKHSHADVAVSVTGIAGPSGGTPTKPVGTVHFAWATRQGGTHAKRLCIEGDRLNVRRQSVEVALRGTVELLDSDTVCAV